MLKSLSTKTLLSWGILASVAHPLANLLIATTRTGFDISIHPISLLSLGNFGWMQISNFVISGLLILGFSIGLKKSIRVGVGKVWGPRFLGLYGFVLIAAGIFTVDPMYGYPQGAPTGLPTELSWHAIVHNLTFFSLRFLA